MNNCIELLNIAFFNNPDNRSLIVGLMFLLFGVYAFFQLRIHIEGLKQMNKFLKDFYSEGDFKVTGVSKFNVRERLKYRIPISPFVSFFNTGTSFFSQSRSIKVFRIVETLNSEGKEFIFYLEITFLQDGLFDINEIDVYEF